MGCSGSKDDSEEVDIAHDSVAIDLPDRKPPASFKMDDLLDYKTWAGSMSMGFLALLIVLCVCIAVAKSGGSTGDTDPDPSVTEPINSALPIGAQPSKSEDDVDLSTEDEKSAESLFIRKDVYIVGNVQKAAIFHPAFDKKYSSDTDVFGQDA
eukprot:180880_1